VPRQAEHPIIDLATIQIVRKQEHVTWQFNVQISLKKGLEINNEIKAIGTEINIRWFVFVCICICAQVVARLDSLVLVDQMVMAVASGSASFIPLPKEHSLIHWYHPMCGFGLQRGTLPSLIWHFLN